jgi:hypothetical protein
VLPDLIYTAVPPCRIADTRAAGGSLAAGSPRDLRVTGIALQGQGGNPEGCDIPVGDARAALLNFVAVNPTGAGNLRAWPYSTPPTAPPLASILNYASVPGSGLNIANAIAVPLCDVDSTECPFDLRVQADGSGTHLVVDVVGFFHDLPAGASAPIIVEETPFVPSSAIGTTCADIQELTLLAPAPGKVVVQATGSFVIEHSTPSLERIVANIALSPSECFVLPALSHLYERVVDRNTSAPTSRETGTFSRVFTVSPGTHTFYLNVLGDNAPGVKRVDHHRMIAVFYPQ